MAGFALFALMNHRPAVTATLKLTDLLRLASTDKEDLYVSWVRGFKSDKDYLARYRFKPCAPLLAYIYDRVSKFDMY